MDETIPESEDPSSNPADIAAGLGIHIYQRDLTQPDAPWFWSPSRAALGLGDLPSESGFSGFPTRELAGRSALLSLFHALGQWCVELAAEAAAQTRGGQ
jgi:hypothetical protein